VLRLEAVVEGAIEVTSTILDGVLPHARATRKVPPHAHLTAERRDSNPRPSS
jgi:hypothetical protein